MTDEKKITVDPAITEMEEKYPEMTKEFKKIMREQYSLFCRKQLNYGPDNIGVGTKCETQEEQRISITGIWFRLFDKANRLKQLVLLNKQDNVGESIQDTFQDLSVYGIIAQIVSRGNWGK